MKKSWKKITLVLLVCLLSISNVPAKAIFAADFEGQESEWDSKCMLSQNNDTDRLACIEYAKYRLKKYGSIQSEASSLSQQMNTIQNDIEALQKLVRKQQLFIDSLNAQIKQNEEEIVKISETVEALIKKIEQKIKDINKRDKAIKNRMISEQSKLGTNIQIEIIMGSNDLMDMISRAQGLLKITERDQDEIKQLKIEKKQLDLQKKEQDRLKKETEAKKEENFKNRENAETVQAQQKELIAQFQKAEASLQEKRRSVQGDMSSIRQSVIDISIANGGDITFNTSGLIRPVNGWISARPWYYPGGGAHLGLDIATGIGTPIVAPGEGIILYANNPVGTNDNGWIGWPQGGGNSICMVTQVNGVTYSVIFFHMRRENFLVRAGDYVYQGQKLGEVGNSGNSTGPHSHIEVFNLGNMSVNDAIRRFNVNADFAWGNGWGETSVYRRCGLSSTPCREQPEDVL